MELDVTSLAAEAAASAIVNRAESLSKTRVFEKAR